MLFSELGLDALGLGFEHRLSRSQFVLYDTQILVLIEEVGASGIPVCCKRIKRSDVLLTAHVLLYRPQALLLEVTIPDVFARIALTACNRWQGLWLGFS